MDSPAFPLVQTKITIPASRPQVIERSNLLQRAREGLECGLMLISAPAGYGKTTFLSNLARNQRDREWAVGWYAIDPEDDKENIFGAYLFQSIVQAIGPQQTIIQSGQIFRVASDVDLQQRIPTLINAVLAYKHPILLVLDDFHLIKNSAILKAVAFLIEHLPENMALAIGTRSEPSLPLARYRARGKLFEVGPADLRFNHDETRLFLKKLLKNDLPPGVIDKLEERTEGWAAGLQLAALSLARTGMNMNSLQAVSGNQKFMADYLIEEVFTGIPAGVQKFLVSTAILERLSASLCDAVLGLSDESAGIIQELERQNYFIVPLDEEKTWYRYHHLFRDFLIAKLEKEQKGETARLHISASNWLANNGLLRESAYHAFACGDWDVAASFVEKNCFQMIIHSELAAISEWCSRFPEDVMDRHPLLCVDQCWGWVFSFHKKNNKKIEARLQQAKTCAERIRDKKIIIEVNESEKVIHQMVAMAPDPVADPEIALSQTESGLDAYPEEDAGRFSLLLNIGYIRMAMNDTPRAEEVLVKAREIAWRANLLFGIVETSFHLARIAHIRGKLNETVRICDETKAGLTRLLRKPEKELPAVGGLDIAAGCALFEQNNVAEAETRLLNGLNLIGWGMNQHYLMVGLTALFHLYKSNNRNRDAEDLLSNLETVWPDISFLTAGFRILTKLKNGNDDGIKMQARKWSENLLEELKDIEHLPGFGPFGACEVYYQSIVTWLRIQSFLDNEKHARIVVDKYLDKAESNRLMDRVIELSLIKMTFEEESRLDTKSWDRFSRTLSEVEDERYFQVFFRGNDSTSILEKTAKRGIRREYIEKIFADYAHRKAHVQSVEQIPGTQVKMGLVSSLSEREKEILLLLEKGETNQGIAEKLVITVGTVKSHINHILGKLDSGNRTQAVARARELGLFN